LPPVWLGGLARYCTLGQYRASEPSVDRLQFNIHLMQKLRFDMQRILPILALSLLAVLASTEPSRAEITYPWCAQYGGGRGGGRNCGFWTYQQCMAALWGNGGYCEVNAMYRGPSPGMIPPPPAIPRRAG
jgi:hypothetical protein